jgi:hypothetical protein
MNRWTSGLASQVQQDGDPQPGTVGPAFRGIDMVRDPDKLAPGMVPYSINKRLRTGSALKRPGSVQPAEFNPDFGANPLNPIIGSGIYSDPNGNERLLVAVKNASYDFGPDPFGVRAFVWSLQAGKDPERIPLAAGQTLAGKTRVRFCQAFDKIALFREPFLDATAGHMLVWDGQPYAVGPPAHTGSFDDVHGLFNPAEGGTEVPVTTAGETFQNRLLLYSPFSLSVPQRDQVIMTDPAHIEQYDEVFGDFRINSGQSDSIVRVFQYYKGAAAVFKHRSIHQIENFSTPDPTAGSQRMLSGEIGLAGPDAAVRDGADILFYSFPGGVYRLSEVIQDQIVTPPIAVSEPIDPIIHTVNMTAARGIVAAADVEYAYFAVPSYVGAPRGNNAVLVYNRQSRLWESAPDFWGDGSFKIHAMHTTNFNGTRTLFGLDYQNKHVYALYQSVPDQLNGQLYHIHDALQTRAYNLGDHTRFNRYQRMAVAISTVDPQVKITAISDGWNEKKLLTINPITKDRFKFYPHGFPDYDGTLPADYPKREDYSVTEFAYAAEDFEALLPGPIEQLPATGGYVDSPAQQTLERLPIRTNGRWVSLVIENLSGRCDVLAVGVEGIAGNMENRTAA